MATALSEYASALRAKPLKEYEWWKHHVIFFGLLFVGLPMLLTLTYGLAGVYSFLGIKSIVFTISNLLLYLLIATIVVTVIGAIPGYYYDAKYLERNDLGYSPRWPLYIAVHVIPVVGPFIAIPLYVIQRYRHAGIPMDRMRS